MNLVGGYYDAGDNVKFGLPMAFTTTLLAWSVIEFGSLMQNQIEHAKAAIRWSTDYLLKAATATPGTLYVQVNHANKRIYFSQTIMRFSGKKIQLTLRVQAYLKELKPKGCNKLTYKKFD